jgi:hypothetical protein
MGGLGVLALLEIILTDGEKTGFLAGADPFCGQKTLNLMVDSPQLCGEYLEHLHQNTGITGHHIFEFLYGEVNDRAVAHSRGCLVMRVSTQCGLDAEELAGFYRFADLRPSLEVLVGQLDFPIFENRYSVGTVALEVNNRISAIEDRFRQ